MLGVICLLILGISACDRKAGKPPQGSQQAAKEAGPKPFKNEVYRAIGDEEVEVVVDTTALSVVAHHALGGEEVVTITSPTELELRVGDKNYICEYTRQDNGIRLVIVINGAKQAVYLSIVGEGLKDPDGAILYDVDHYQPAMDAVNKQRDPSNIQRMLNDHYQGKPVSIPAFFSEVGEREAMTDGLLAARTDGLPLSDPQVGPKGKGIIRSVFYPFGTKPLRVELEHPCILVVNKVTRCRTEKGCLTAEFNLRPEYPAAIQKYLAGSTNVTSSPNGLNTRLAGTFSSEDIPSHGKATFVKSDDGWHLSSVSP
jgi:hypothetical protein